MRRANILWSQKSQVGQDASARLIHDDESVEGVYEQYLWKKWKYSKDTVSWRKQINKIWTKQVLWKLTSTRASKLRLSKLWGAFKSSFELWDLWLDLIWAMRPLTWIFVEFCHTLPGLRNLSRMLWGRGSFLILLELPNPGDCAVAIIDDNSDIYVCTCVNVP